MDSEVRKKIIASRLKKRYAKEKAFRLMGLGAVFSALVMLAILFSSIIGNGYSAFQQTFIQLEVVFDAGEIDPDGNRDPEVLSQAN
ncbi:MAG: DUF3333 domain-containing protein, partial [Proteobacteria bacterium]|nr:DUF3333 domain-containing protein [Pseudomonadota bacterium]